MDHSELIKILLNQVKERDELIKTLSENLTKLSDAYIIKDKEKDKRHMKTVITIIVLSLLTLSFFIGSYFWSDYPISTINGNGNSTITGNDNSNNQNGGAN